MFSRAEKEKIAAAIEKLLLDLDHPEMPKEMPYFMLRVKGKEVWSDAEICPNWMFCEKNPPHVNPWNEIARDVLQPKKKEE